MRKLSVTQVDTGTWAADSTIAVDIERVGLITRIDVTVEVTPSATLVAANQPDGLFRLIRNMRILGGSHTYVTLPSDDGCQGGVLLHYMGVRDKFGPGHESGDVTAPSATYVPINYPIHLGSRPWSPLTGAPNPFDLTAFIPAFGESQLRAEWQTSGNDVVDDTVTITSAVARFTLHRVTGSPAEIAEEMAIQGVRLPPGANGMVPSWSAAVHANAGVTTDFDTEQIDITTGAFLKRLWVLTQDATATRTLRASDTTTELAIRVPKTSEDLYRTTVEHQLSLSPAGTVLTADDAVSFGAVHTAEGIYAIDFRPMSGPSNPYGVDYGWDLRGLSNGDFKLGLINRTRAAGDDDLLLHERYSLYDGPLA